MPVAVGVERCDGVVEEAPLADVDLARESDRERSFAGLGCCCR